MVENSNGTIYPKPSGDKGACIHISPKVNTIVTGIQILLLWCSIPICQPLHHEDSLSTNCIILIISWSVGLNFYIFHITHIYNFAYFTFMPFLSFFLSFFPNHLFIQLELANLFVPFFLYPFLAFSSIIFFHFLISFFFTFAILFSFFFLF